MTQDQFMLAVQRLSSPLLDAVMRAVSDLATTPLYVLVASYLFWRVERRRGAALGLLMVFSSWANSLIKMYVAEPRPAFEGLRNLSHTMPKDFGFPSGHSQAAAAFATFMAVWLATSGRRGWAWALGCFPLVVGFSRIYLGVHFPSEVAGGLSIGFLLGLAFSRPGVMDALATMGPAILGVVMAALAVGPIELALAGIWTGFVLGLARFAFSGEGRRPMGLEASAVYLLGGMVLTGLVWVAVGLIPAIPLGNTPGLWLVRRAMATRPPTEAHLNAVFFMRGVAAGLVVTYYPRLAGLRRQRELV